MTVSLYQLVKDWLEANGWDALEVKSSQSGGYHIQPKYWGTNQESPTSYIGGAPFVTISEDKVGYINAADPEFFEKLDEYLVKKYFGGSAWHQHKTNPPKPRVQIWPKQT